MKPFQRFETLFYLPKADFDSAKAVIDGAKAVIDAGELIVQLRLQAVDSATKIVDAGADHRGNEHAESEGASDDRPDDRLRVAAHGVYGSTGGRMDETGPPGAQAGECS